MAKSAVDMKSEDPPSHIGATENSLHADILLLQHEAETTSNNIAAVNGLEAVADMSETWQDSASQTEGNTSKLCGKEATIVAQRSAI